MAPPTHGWPSAVSTEPCAYSCSPKWCRWCVVCVTRHRQVSPRALYRSHCVFSSSSSFRAFAAAAASSAARPTGRGDIRNPFAAVADLARAMVSSASASGASSIAAVSVTRFTAARATPGSAFSTFDTAAEQPPHRMPSTRKSIVSGDSVPDAAGGDAARSPMAGASSVAEAARALVEAKRLDGERKCVSPAERCHRGVDAAGTATRVASGRMVNRVGRTATGHGRWTARAAVKPARIDLITGTRARHTPTIASPVAHRAMCAACRRSALVLSWIAGDIRKRVWLNWHELVRLVRSGDPIV